MDGYTKKPRRQPQSDSTRTAAGAARSWRRRRISDARLRRLIAMLETLPPDLFDAIDKLIASFAKPSGRRLLRPTAPRHDPQGHSRA